MAGTSALLGGTVVAAFLLGWGASPAAAEDPAVPGDDAAGLAARRAGLPRVLRDTSLVARLRSHYLDVHGANGVERQAWALGGWLAYRSGWLLDTVQAGATLFGSAPAYAPADKADTLLLAPGREGFYALGEAFAALRYREIAALKLYRQALDEPYVNRQDNAMAPNTFEGVMVGGRWRRVEYAAGYLARMKARNADAFVPMSEAAGAPGSDEGLALLRVRAEALRRLEVTLSEQYGFDTFNTLFVQVEHAVALGRGAELHVGTQLTDQRAVGAALVGAAPAPGWDVRNASARVALAYRELTFEAGGSVTTSGNRIQSPWGFFPGYLRMDQQQFNGAAEKAWLLGIAYESRSVIRGLSASASAAWGTDSIDPGTGASLGDEAEYDLVVAYRPAAIPGLLLRTRGLLYRRDGADRLGDTFRFTINWEIPLLRPEPITAAEASSRPGARRGERGRRSEGPIAADPAAGPR
jgi:hypothetical protein